MNRITSLLKLRAPLGAQEIELQQVDLDSGGMSLLRTRIREHSRFTVFDIDPQTAAAWGEALLQWARAQESAMSAPRAIDDPAVDVAFALEGRSLPRDHAQALADALAARLPWLAGAPDGGRPSGQGGAGQRAAGLAVAARAAAAARAAVARGRRWRRWPAARSASAAARCGWARRRRTGCCRTARCMRTSWPPAATTRPPSCATCTPNWTRLRVDAHTVCGKRQQRRSDAGGRSSASA